MENPESTMVNPKSTMENATSPMPVSFDNCSASSLYAADFPDGHIVLSTPGDGKLCGLNAMTTSAAEQGIKTPPTLPVLQGIVKRTEYAANVLAYGPDPDHAAIEENNFTQVELALILKLYGERIKQPLRLAIGKLSRTQLIFQILTCL